jgi:succinate dehydrogenase/fumarate reductase cytochrome b subunit
MTIATFTFVHVLLSLIGIVSLAILAVTVVARYRLGRGGPWRRIYVIGAAGALYLNVFVGVVQAFLKVAALKTLAPRQTDGPFLLAQGVVLVLFIGLTIQALKRFR